MLGRSSLLSGRAASVGKTAAMIVEDESNKATATTAKEIVHVQ